MNPKNPIKCLRLAHAHAASILRAYTKDELRSILGPPRHPQQATKQELIDLIIDSQSHICFYVQIHRKQPPSPTVD